MADTAVTISKTRVSPLSTDEIATYGVNTKFKVLYTDIDEGTGTEDTVTMTLGTTAAGWYCDKAFANVTTAFAGTTAITMAVGTTSSTAAFISAQSIKSAGPLEMVSTLPILTNAMGTVALSLVATFTNGTAGSPSALSAGELDIYLNLVKTADLP